MKVKVSPDFDFKKVLEDSLDIGFRHRISKLIKIKKQMIALREMSYKRLELDIKDSERKKINSQLKEIDNLEKICDDELNKEEEYVKLLLKQKSGHDKYGVPNAVSFEAYEKNFSNRDMVLFRKQCRDFIKKDKGFDWSKLSEDEIDASLDYVMGYMPYILKLVGKIEGEGYQQVIRPLRALFEEGLLKGLSHREGKTFETETHKKVIEQLKPYWDDNLPLGHNVKTWFNKIADDNKIIGGYSSVKQMERRFRKKYAPHFVPSRK